MTTPGEQFGINDAQMQQIIEATNESLSQMRMLNNQVQGQAGALATANQSDSGKVLVNKFQTWSGDFAQIENQLKELNQRVLDLRNAALSFAQDATSTVSGSDL